MIQPTPQIPDWSLPVTVGILIVGTVLAVVQLTRLAIVRERRLAATGAHTSGWGIMLIVVGVALTLYWFAVALLAQFEVIHLVTVVGGAAGIIGGIRRVREAADPQTARP